MSSVCGEKRDGLWRRLLGFMLPLRRFDVLFLFSMSIVAAVQLFLARERLLLWYISAEIKKRYVAQWRM